VGFPGVLDRCERMTVPAGPASPAVTAVGRTDLRSGAMARIHDCVTGLQGTTARLAGYGPAA
jgi:hypothetical protein